MQYISTNWSVLKKFRVKSFDSKINKQSFDNVYTHEYQYTYIIYNIYIYKYAWILLNHTKMCATTGGKRFIRGLKHCTKDELLSMEHSCW